MNLCKSCVSEAIGLALPYSAGTPAPYEERDKYAYESGQAVMNLLEKKIKPREIVTKKSLENAATIVAATGGSTNAALHLPALANEIGVKFNLMDVAKIFKKTPYPHRTATCQTQSPHYSQTPAIVAAQRQFEG